MSPGVDLDALLDALADAIAARVAERLPKAPPASAPGAGLEHAQAWLTQKQAAEYLGCTPKQLQGWRARGEGPQATKVSRRALRYARSGLDKFMRGKEGAR